MTRRSSLILAATIGFAVLAMDAYVGRCQAPPTQQQQAQQHSSRAGFNQTPPESVVPPSSADLHAGDKERQAKKDAEDSAALGAYQSTANATWGLVVGTICLVLVGFYVGWKQMGFMERQEKIAERQVAIQEMLVQLERPWLAIRITEEDVTEAVAANREVASCAVSVSNYGRNPAWIVEACCSLQLLPLPLSDSPPYGSATAPAVDVPVPAGQAVTVSRMSQAIPEEVRISLRKWDDDRLCLVAFGFIRYRTPMDANIHEKRFCRTWYNRHMPYGPPGWRDTD